MKKSPTTKITYEDGYFTFTLQDESGFVVTDGKDLDELYKNIKESLDLHYQDRSYTININTPIRLSLTSNSYATNI